MPYARTPANRAFDTRCWPIVALGKARRRVADGMWAQAPGALSLLRNACQDQRCGRGKGIGDF